MTEKEMICHLIELAANLDQIETNTSSMDIIDEQRKTIQQQGEMIELLASSIRAVYLLMGKMGPHDEELKDEKKSVVTLDEIMNLLQNIERKKGE
jgi:citrate synthase